MFAHPAIGGMLVAYLLQFCGVSDPLSLFQLEQSVAVPHGGGSWQEAQGGVVDV